MKHRKTALALLFCFLYQILFPVTSYALTGGPSQPEVESFEPVGTSEMVDLFTGDFSYNIPLLDIDGYPINIAYHSGITMDQEASWVGLGWNINPGVINRNMRGIPDDFNGDNIEKIQYVKPDKTYGVNMAFGFELFGKAKKDGALKKFLNKLGSKPTMELGLGINYNNYKGLGIESRITPAINASIPSKTKLLQKIGFNAKMDIASSSKDGFSIRPQVGMSTSLYGNNQTAIKVSNNTSVGMAISSRGGVKSLSIQSGFSVKRAMHIIKENDALGIGQATYKDVGGSVANGGGTISFGTQTYTPAIGMAFNNFNLSLKGTVGWEVKGLDPNVGVTGYFASQELVSTNLKRPAYGTMYLQNKSGYDNMLDFNREKDGSYSEKNPTLAIPILTYDVYSASGQGIGGNYRPYRSDLPVVSDPDMQNVSDGANIGAEVSIGGYVKVGLNPIVNYTEVKSGAWERDNDLLRKFNYKGKSLEEPYYEPVYFKNVGEKVAVDTTSIAYHQLNRGALRPTLGEIAPMLASKAVFLKSDKLEGMEGGNHYETDINALQTTKSKPGSRDKRNQLFSYLTVAESEYCLEDKLLDDNTYLGYTPISWTVYRKSKVRASSHITEVSVTNAQGARYVYGIPAYNNTQYDISFTYAYDPDNKGQLPPDAECETGQIEYDDTEYNFDAPDFSSRRFKGNDHAMNITKTPGYAHSYLLTAVLSPDYIDADDVRGPSRGDYGNYTKISYDRVDSCYKWRVPYNENRANYSEGLKSDKTDDNASIIYGEKEVWMVRKIEGKQHYALFHLSPRHDALGVTGIHGGRNDDAKSYKLDSIQLFTIDAGELIKTVHFEYSYKLCKGVDNSDVSSGDDGKLTLTKLYFTYGKSRKGRFNSYEFNYEGSNPDYNLKSYDRWGNYKPHSCVNDHGVTTLDYPYTSQDKSLTDAYAAAWSLTSIVLPSGGTIRIEYESDDYAFVQDQRAMQMAKIKCFGDDPGGLSSASPTTPYSSIPHESSFNLFDGKDPNEIIYFELPYSVNNQDPNRVKENILNSKTLYYNCLVNLYNQEQDHYEYVRGYTEIVDAGVINMKQSSNPVGWIKVQLQDEKYHPISKSAWQYARMYMPQLAYPGSNLRNKADKGSGETAKAIIKGILGFVIDAAEMINGINDKLQRLGKGRTVDVANSWIRINNLTGAKLGGGVRVKKLELNDQWSELSGGGINMGYGQTYEYTMSGTYNGVEQIISSGVAAYEPTIGGDENPFRNPVSYSKKNIGVPNDEFYSEDPFGESYFPAPLVGYSRVTVKPLVPDGVSLKQHGTGKVVHEFYTAKDFPVFTSRTGITPKHHTSSPIFKLIGFKGEDHMAATQGFQIELNDMHGKPKAVRNYTQANIASNEVKDAFSSIEYEYAVENPNAEAKKLTNLFKVIDSKNNISNQVVGVESEMVLDTRKQTSQTYSGGISLNLDVIKLALLPVPVFTAWPDFSSEQTSFKTAVITRVVNRYGILKRTIATEEGASIVTENVLLDAETGETLLTRTYNEFKDPVYNTTIPAHWVYDGMGQSYKNYGMEIELVNNTASGTWADFTTKVSGVTGYVEKYLTEGDEVILTQTYNTGPNTGKVKERKKMWVFKNDYGYFLMDKLGNIRHIDEPGYTFTAKVIRSGRRNMQNVPVMSYTSLDSCIVNNKLVIDSTKQVLNASATVYSFKWGINKLPTKQQYDPNVVLRENIEIFNFLLKTNQLNMSKHHGDDFVIVNGGSADSVAYYNSTIRSLIPVLLGYYNDTCTVIKDSAGSSLDSVYFGFALRGLNGDMIVDEDSIPVRHVRIYIPANWEPLEIEYIYNSDGNGNPNTTSWVFAKVKLKYKVGGVVYEKELVAEFNDGWSMINQMSCESYKFTVNPYMAGIRGSWRKQQDWVYYDARKPENVNTGSTNIRKNGTYKTFTPFWIPPASGTTGPWTKTSDTIQHWAKTNEITKYNINGSATESKDALNKYSAIVYGFNYTLPIAVANNAKYNQIGSFSAEDYLKILFNNNCDKEHFFFEMGYDQLSEVAHTGKYSILLSDTTRIVSANYDIKRGPDVLNEKYVYRINNNDYDGLFAPDSGRYVVSAWVKVGNDLKQTTYNDSVSGPRMYVWNGNGPVWFYPTGPIIEGWQKIEGVFNMSTDADRIKISLYPIKKVGVKTWYDDIRVFPYNANMKSYVYNWKTNKLMAELDENNYATFYEYDQEGKLARVKKETERGIVTIKEVRSQQHKKAN